MGEHGKYGQLVMGHSFLTRAYGNRLAFHKTEGQGPAVIFCGGFMSDMDGSKALALEGWAKTAGRAFIRFDYFGHGKSDGAFEDGTISRWADDIAAIIDGLTDGKVILVGSSMGGWASLLTAVNHADRVAGLVLIAPAPDFTHKLMWAQFDEATRKQIMEQGKALIPSDYDEPYPVTKTLIEDGRARQIMDAPIAFKGPVRILQGKLDTPVPYAHSRKLVELITSEDVTYTLVKDGDHSLSRPQDLRRLMATVEEISAVVNESAA